MRKIHKPQVRLTWKVPSDVRVVTFTFLMLAFAVSMLVLAYKLAEKVMADTPSAYQVTAAHGGGHLIKIASIGYEALAVLLLIAGLISLIAICFRCRLVKTAVTVIAIVTFLALPLSTLGMVKQLTEEQLRKVELQRLQGMCPYLLLSVEEAIKTNAMENEKLAYLLRTCGIIVENSKLQSTIPVVKADDYLVMRPPTKLRIVSRHTIRQRLP